MYNFRNLSCVGKTHFIEGKSINDGCGVLEWCWDKSDAEYILSEMLKDSQFSDLSIGEWQTEDNANDEMAEDLFWNSIDDTQEWFEGLK